MQITKIFGLLGLVLGLLSASPLSAQTAGYPSPMPLGNVLPTTDTPMPENTEAYTVNAIAVDVTAASAAAARDKAIFDGQRAALTQLLDRMDASKGVDPTKLNDNKIASLVKNFEIVTEKTSTVRYIATMNVRFKPRAVQALLGNAGVHYVANPTLPRLILPVITSKGRPVLWEERTVWRDAVEKLDRHDNLQPILIPAGDLKDIGVIDAKAALAGDALALGSIATTYQAGAVIVAAIASDAATLNPQQPLAVTLTRYDSSGQRQEGITQEIPPAATQEAQMAAATQSVLDFIQQKNQTVPTAAPAIDQAAGNSLQVYAPLGSLPELTRLRQKLATVTSIRRINIATIRRDGADLVLDFSGDAPALQQAMSQQGLVLLQAPTGQWQVRSN